MILDRKQLLIILALLFISAAVLRPQPLSAQDDELLPIRMEVEAGFDGFYKEMFWVPIHINVSNEGPQIEGAVEITVDDVTGDEVVYRSPIILPTRSHKQLTLYVYLTGYVDELQVDLVDVDGRIIATAATNSMDRLSADALLYGIVGRELDELEKLGNAAGDRNEAAAAFLQLDHLPDAPAAWNALDIIFIHDVDSSEISTGQREALVGWIENGGQLVVVGGPSWQQSTAGLGDLLPVKVSGLSQISDLPALVNQTGIEFRDPGPYLVNDSVLQSGELLIQQDGLPLLARREIGRGAVNFLALDPNLAPLADWDGSEILWSTIASLAPRLPVWGLGAQNGYSASTAISSLPSVALPSAILLFVFLFLYVLVVGPVNYLVLKRIGRRELAWASIPVLVLIFSGSAYLAGFRLKGNDIIINEMSIAYGSTDSDRLRVQSLLGLYSPRRGSFDMTLPGDSVVRPFSQDFGSLSGAGHLDSIDRGSEVTLSGVRVDVSGIESFAADSYQDTPALTGQASLNLKDNNYTIKATVQNNSDTTFENAVVLIGNAAVSLGDLSPGDIKTGEQSISRAQLTAATSSVSGPPGIVMASPGTSPLARNFETILGTANYFDDPEVFPRWQLLQAIAPEYGSTAHYIPRATATLVGWSDESQIEANLKDRDVRRQSTTLYFLELPFTQTTVTGSGVVVPPTFLEWKVLAQSGIYHPTIMDLHMGTGWVEFEYEPWSEFQDLAVNELQIVMERGNAFGAQPLPLLQLWDWQDEAWKTVQDVEWGATPISEYARYVGIDNAVRIRLQNDTNDVTAISEIYPSLTGDVE